MLMFRAWLSSLLAILIYNSIGSANTETPANNEEVYLVNVGVPESDTEIGPNPAADGFNSRRLRAFYYWPDRSFCGRKFKVQAVTTLENAGGCETSRHFLIITLDHRPLDILELSDSNNFFTDEVKLGRFILTQTVWSCDKLRLEYRMAGGGCRARDYWRMKTFVSEKEEGQDLIAEDYKWEAFDDDCGSPQVTLM